MVLIVCVYVYMYTYYELIVFLYVGMNTFWMFDFFRMLKCHKLQLLSLLCMFINCYQYWSLYRQLLLYAYHVKLRKAYAKLVFTRKGTAN